MSDHERGPSQSPKWPLWFFLATLLAAALLRLLLARMAKHPGHADLSFYYLVAENLARGRGPVLDVVGQFVNNPQSLPCYANDYWMPLASWIISFFLRAGGDSLFVALIPSMLCGTALGGLSILAGRLVVSSWSVGFCAGAIVLVLPPLLKYSLVTDGAIYYACWICAGLLSLMQARRHACPAVDSRAGENRPIPRLGSPSSPVRWLFLAAVCGGLAHLTRQDGCLFLLVVLFCVFRMPWTRPRRAWVCGACAVIHAVILLPWLAANVRHMGRLVPCGSPRMVFLTTFEDFFATETPISLTAFLDWGIGNIVRSKVSVGLSHIRIFHELLGELACIAVLISLMDFLTRRESRERLRALTPVFIFGGVLYSFYTLIATFPGEMGGFLRSVLALLPFLVVQAVDAFWRHLQGNKAIAGVVVLCVLFGIARGVVFTNGAFQVPRMLAEHASRAQEFESAGQLALSSLLGKPSRPVIMARDPYGVHAATGIPAVQIPNESLDAIWETAKKFHVTHLLLPAPRTSLAPIADRTISDPRIVFIGEGPQHQWSLWRLDLDADAATGGP